MTEKKTGLDLLREPFPEHQISKLPKPTSDQTEALKEAMKRKDFSVGVKCKLCGGWHHKDAIHLDYVGHAALTYRLLDCDPEWNWEPFALQDGLPAFDKTGGLWIRLTVCGVTRLGYGHAAIKSQQEPGSREKEVIGDALRNAAMRFGAALDLWHKGDLHLEDEPDAKAPPKDAPQTATKAAPKDDTRDPRQIADKLLAAIADRKAVADLDKTNAVGSRFADALKWLADGHPAMALEVQAAFDKRRAELSPKPAADLGWDAIPF